MILSNVEKPEELTSLGAPPGMVTRNKKLAEKLAANKKDKGTEAAADPKKKAAPPAKAEAAAPAKKDAKGKGKG